MMIPEYPRDILKTSDFEQLRQQNKNLTETLSKLAKYANQFINGDCSCGLMDEAISEANDTLIGNSIILIDFPAYLKKKYDIPVFSGKKEIIEKVIDIYNEWNK